MSRFVSAFGAHMESMLTYRVAHGYKEKTYLPTLARFDKFCFENYPESNELTREIVHEWLDSETESCLTSLATTIRQFGKFLQAIGKDAYILPYKSRPKRSKFTPYIFTDAELAALFSEIDKLEPNKHEPFIHEVAPVLFRMIYTCGLRPGEGRNLLYSNVNLDTGELFITNTKFAKERIVVMSDDMLNLCRAYVKTRNIFGSNSQYFFPAMNRGRFESAQITSMFTKAWNRTSASANNPLPHSVRIYDLRHRFASACLNRWLDEERDLIVMLPYLRAYMGHGKIAETAYYIHLLPENLVKTSAINWATFNSLLPEVNVCPD